MASSKFTRGMVVCSGAVSNLETLRPLADLSEAEVYLVVMLEVIRGFS